MAQLLVRQFLIPDVSADFVLISPDSRNEVAPRPEFVTEELRSLRSTFCAIQIELFPLRYPITSATEYFGGIDISMCT